MLYLQFLILAVPDLVRHDHQSVAVDEGCGAGSAGGHRGSVVQQLDASLGGRPLLPAAHAVHDGSNVLHELIVRHAVQLLHWGEKSVRGSLECSLHWEKRVSQSLNTVSTERKGCHRDSEYSRH